MLQKLKSISHFLRLPAVCKICSSYHRDPHAICEACFSLFNPLGPACLLCAMPLADAGFLRCGQCIKHPPAFDRTLTAYRFEYPLRQLLHEYKYHGALHLGSIFARLMHDALPSSNFLNMQCLVPVPLHPKRLRQRGFNQAAQLAQILAKQLHLPCELTVCHKRIHTSAQVSLNEDARRRNLKHAFAVHPTAYERITLVDDLLTTGSTAHHLARLFKHQGVREVNLWCCARAIPKLG